MKGVVVIEGHRVNRSHTLWVWRQASFDMLDSLATVEMKKEIHWTETVSFMPQLPMRLNAYTEESWRNTILSTAISNHVVHSGDLYSPVTKSRPSTRYALLYLVCFVTYLSRTVINTAPLYQNPRVS